MSDVNKEDYFCIGCKASIDFEDVFFNNQCPYCGASQGYGNDYYLEGCK